MAAARSHGSSDCLRFSLAFESWCVNSVGCGHHDSPTALCAGATDSGKLVNITTDEMQRRCAAEDKCVAYWRSDGPITSTFRPVTALDGYCSLRTGGATYQKEDLCALDLHGDGSAAASTSSSSTPSLVDAMKSWAEEAWKAMPSSHAHKVHALIRKLRNVSSSEAEALHAVTHAKRDVLYLLSGADLITIASLFPNAPSYTMLANFPAGDPRCFLSSGCRQRATLAFHNYYHDLLLNLGGWTETQHMVVWFLAFRNKHANVTSGVLPILVATLHAVGHTLTAIERTTAHGVRLVCAGGPSVLYVNRGLGAALHPWFDEAAAGPLATAAIEDEGACSRYDMLSRRNRSARLQCLEANHTSALPDSLAPQLAWLSQHVLTTGKRYTTVIKAAGPARDMLNSALVAPWIVHVSDALLQDETGLLPSKVHEYSRGPAAWSMSSFGNYSDQRRIAYKKLMISMPLQFEHEHSQELHDVYNGSRKLGFIWGYGAIGSPGLMLVASRREDSSF